MVVSGGVNIYPAEAELLLIDHPDIADVQAHLIPGDGPEARLDRVRELLREERRRSRRVQGGIHLVVCC